MNPPQQTSSTLSRKRSRGEEHDDQTSQGKQPLKRLKLSQQVHEQLLQRLPRQTTAFPTTHAPSSHAQRNSPRNTSIEASTSTNDLDFLDGVPLWSSRDQRKPHVDRIRSLHTCTVEFLDLLPSHDLRTHRLAQGGKKEACKAMYGIITRHLGNKHWS